MEALFCLIMMDRSARIDEAEAMDNLEYDSDATNVSMSTASDNRGTIDDDTDVSDNEAEESDEVEIEAGSPVLGDRILQDGMILSQRARERARTPVLEGSPPRRRENRPTIDYVDETDSDSEDSEEIDGADEGNFRIHVPRSWRVIDTESFNEGSLNSSSNLSIQAGQGTSADLDESSSDSRSPLLQGGQSTSDSRLSLVPGMSTSDSRSSLFPEQSTSGSRSPVLEEDTADTRSSPLPVPSTSRSSPLATGNLTSVVDPSTVPDRSDQDSDQAQQSAKPHEEKTPQKSKPVEVPASPESDDEGQICSICFEPWANSGAHRLASLKCGHIFGNSCIGRWLKGQGGKCPQCNAKATKKDIRVLYAKSLKVLDTSERDRVVKELETEKEAKRKLELEHAQTKLRYDLKSQMVVRLQNELKMLRNAACGSSVKISQGISMSLGTSSDTKNKLVIHSGLDIVKDGGCRVMAYNEWLNMVVVSMPSQVNMFPGAGVKKINMLDVKTERYIPIHQKQIRDMAFNPAKNDLLLSVGMDKMVKLTNVCNNAPVGSFTAEVALWTCCWNADQANQFFVGTTTGSVIVYDTRNTNGPVQTFKVSGTGPVVSMCYVPYNASANFMTGGLLVARLSSCSFVVVREDDVQDHPLVLLEGPFTSISFEKTTRHFMVSCRPSQKYPHARHLVCELQNVDISSDNTARNQMVTVNTIQSFRGGTTQKVLSRSTIIAHPFQAGSILACASDESTQSTCVWDVSTGKCVQQLKCKETVIDLIQIKNNQSAYIALLTDKSVKFYKWVDVL